MNPVILDTCILISGLLSPAGASGALLSAFFNDRLKIAYTSQMLAEYVDVLGREKFGFSTNDRMSFVIKLRASAIHLTPVPVPEIDWPDEKDLPFIAAALATEAKTVITLNPRDFAPAKALGLRILSPAQALTLLRT